MKEGLPAAGKSSNFGSNSALGLTDSPCEPVTVQNRLQDKGTQEPLVDPIAEVAETVAVVGTECIVDKQAAIMPADGERSG